MGADVLGSITKGCPMLKRFVRSIAVVVLLVATSTVLFASDEKSLTNDELVAMVAKLDVLTLVTPEAVKMPPLVWTFCRAPGPNDVGHSDFPKNPDAHFKVFVTSAGAGAMKDVKAAFPIGTVILKQKLAKKDDGAPVLYTGMLKREKGFNATCGDWEFFLVSGDGKTVTDRGKIQSCMRCHVKYSGSDFVTKKY